MQRKIYNIIFCYKLIYRKISISETNNYKEKIFAKTVAKATMTRCFNERV